MSGCDVCLFGDFEDDNTFYQETMRRARKTHVCCECGQTIPSGATYQRAVGKYDGRIWAYKTCGSCAEVREIFYCGGGWYFEHLWDDMEQQAFSRLTTASECFRELSPGAKAFVLERWSAWRGLTEANGAHERRLTRTSS